MNDPYLIPGQVCEVWDCKEKPNFIPVARFKMYGADGRPRFRRTSPQTSYVWDHYRPMGTEWDFAPDWAVCCTVYKDGSVRLWNNEKHAEHFNKKDTRWLISHSQFCVCECGICPDTTRYQGDNWRDSLRLRPDWAKGKK